MTAPRTRAVNDTGGGMGVPGRLFTVGCAGVLDELVDVGVLVNH